MTLNLQFQQPEIVEIEKEISETTKSANTDANTPKVTEVFCTAYYDLSTNEEAPLFEKQIIKYLELNNVHMSDPSEKINIMKYGKKKQLSSTNVLNSVGKRKNSLWEKRMKQISHSSKDLIGTIKLN